MDPETGEKYVIVGGEEEWRGHLRSRKHRRRERGNKKARDWELWRERQNTEGEGVVVVGGDTMVDH